MTKKARCLIAVVATIFLLTSCNQPVEKSVSESSAVQVVYSPTKDEVTKMGKWAAHKALNQQGVDTSALSFSVQSSATKAPEKNNTWIYASEIEYGGSTYPFSLEMRINRNEQNTSFVYECLKFECDTGTFPVNSSSTVQDEIKPDFPRSDPLISYAEYTKIETGMTYDEVCEIVGSYGYEMARTEMAGYQTVIVGWDGEGMIGANANVTFQNGKVFAKAQAGLK